MVLRSMDLSTSTRIDGMAVKQERNTENIYQLLADARSLMATVAALHVSIDSLYSRVDVLERGDSKTEVTLRSWLTGVTAVLMVIFLTVFYILIVHVLPGN